jgi:hypothetical protein
VDVAERVRVVTGHEVGPRLLEERVEPVLGADVDLVPVLDGGRQLGRVDRRRALLVEADRGRVVRARHREVREVAHTGVVVHALDALVDRADDALERLDRGHRLAELNVRDTAEELRADVVLRLARDLREEAERILVLTVAVLVPAEQVVELPVQVALVVVVELLDLRVVVLAHALDDVGRLGQVGRELREPEERLVELEVVRLVGDLGEDAVRGLVELQAVERDREVVLRELLVALVVLGLALVDAVEPERRVEPLLAVEEALRLGGGLGHLARRGGGLLSVGFAAGCAGSSSSMSAPAAAPAPGLAAPPFGFAVAAGFLPPPFCAYEACGETRASESTGTAVRRSLRARDIRMRGVPRGVRGPVSRNGAWQAGGSGHG